MRVKGMQWRFYTYILHVFRYSDFRCSYRISEVVRELGMRGGFWVKKVSGYVRSWTCASANFSCLLLSWARTSIKSWQFDVTTIWHAEKEQPSNRHELHTSVMHNMRKLTELNSKHEQLSQCKFRLKMPTLKMVR